MTGPDGPGDGTASIESLWELQLRALLNDLVKDQGPVKAAEELGIDRKTLWRSEGAGQMSPRLAEALERRLLERAAAANQKDRERVRSLEERVALLEEQLDAANNGGMADGNAVVTEALRVEWSEGLRRLERRVERLEAGSAQGNVPEQSSPGWRRLQRRYPDLVTREPASDDQEVYGVAYPLVEEWRTLWAIHRPRGRGLAWVLRRQRILELEVSMMEDHGLTLPPETAPLQGLDRNDQLSWRERELAKVRQRRARLELLHWVGRALTLRLWRGDQRQ